MKLTIAPEELMRTFGERLGDARRKRMIHEAFLQLNVNIPQVAKTVLNPPHHTLLLPKDSVVNFFKKGYTERTQPNTAYLSSPYSISAGFRGVERRVSSLLAPAEGAMGARRQV